MIAQKHNAPFSYTWNYNKAFNRTEVYIQPKSNRNKHNEVQQAIQNYDIGGNFTAI